MITDKDINSLNQLDRIEYRQRRSEIKKESGYNPLPITAYTMLGLTIFLMINDIYFKLILNIETTFLKDSVIWIIIYGLVGFILWIVCLILYNNKIEKLNKEYFNIKPKKEVKHGR